MHPIVMSPCHSVSFEYLPKSGSAWPQGIGISHLDIARLLFQVIHQLQTHQHCLQVTHSRKGVTFLQQEACFNMVTFKDGDSGHNLPF